MPSAKLDGHEFNFNSTNNEFGAGSEFRPNGINNSFGVYGSETSDLSARNPFARNAPKLYDSQGNYRGKLSANEFDPESISIPYGRYGNPFSPDSINNPFGAGNEFRHDSPNNPYGPEWKIVGGEVGEGTNFFSDELLRAAFLVNSILDRLL